MDDTNKTGSDKANLIGTSGSPTYRVEHNGETIATGLTKWEAYRFISTSGLTVGSVTF